jgi:ABC-type Fe3+/spermidine/putrescine transport system ATPase subunit
LLLDEPLAALDRKLRKEMQGELRSIQREVGITFLYVTHDQKVALSLSDRIGIMNEGRVIQVGRPAEIYEKPQTRFVASFIGAGNIFSGKVVAHNGNGLVIQDKYGLRILAKESQGIRDEEVAGLSVHPEMIEVLPPNKKPLSSDIATNLLMGRITEIYYQGDFTELVILINQTDKTVTVHLNRCNTTALPLSVGQDVNILWDPSHSILFTG